MTVLPPLIVGPFIGSDMPGCLTVAFSLLSGGDPGKCNLMRKASVVHINDVAMAHIFLFESTKATNGRYICSCTDITIHQLVELFSAKYPELQLQPDLLRGVEEEKPVHLSSKKLLNLGFEFKHDVEGMVDDAIRCCKENGFL
ncbi:hypothetical protein GIB67_042120 [Kingdonia uniflora]|uniref:Anthocyanidin reductase n=1 Tax=Kingdonia uniflora TaxID=39325 RepID=A0A7J7NNX4_9MAGN|nr:hypothetical protein GIB67_042120 [Kingdonia uniflora]